MNLNQEVAARLAALSAQGLRRTLRLVVSAQGSHIQSGGKTLLNFSSNDYLSLANHPVLKEASIRAVEHYGIGSGASRLVCGSLAPHHELEEALAAFKGTEAALSFSSGYTTALGTICALLGKDDTLILDKLVHACIVDAARLSGAQLRVFKHNDPDDLERILKSVTAKAGRRSSSSKTLVVTESVFSMDGDCAPLHVLVALKERYGAWLMVDEAHTTGLCGEHGQGLAGQLGLSNRIEIQMGTLGKALGASGGFVAGSRQLVEFLVNHARTFIFSTAPPPAAAAAAAAAVALVRGSTGDQLRQKLWAGVQRMRATWVAIKASLPANHHPILPLLVGDERKAVALAEAVQTAGFFVPAIRYPTVARGAARLRFTTTATHSEADHRALHRALNAVRQDPPE